MILTPNFESLKQHKRLKRALKYKQSAFDYSWMF